MKNRLINRRGLGTPVASLIVLTAAVVLSTTVVVFATSVTTSQVQKENLFISSSHIWYVNGTCSVAGVVATNTGPTDIIFTRITVKGLQCQWNGTDSFVIYTKSNETLRGDIPLMQTLSNTFNRTITIGNQPYTFTAAQEGLTLKSGDTIAFYIAVPNQIMVYDLSAPVRMLITTMQSIYVTETLVQAT